MKDILDIKILEDLEDIINFNNIKLLEKPEIKENTTILKLICNKSLKCSLKKIKNI